MKWTTALLGIALALTVTGCAHGSSDHGLAFKPIRPTPDDMVCISDSLVDQILAHDLTGKKLYGWKP